MQVKINTTQKEYLLDYILKDHANLFSNIREYHKIYYIDVTEKDADSIRDLCCEMLDTRGFNEKYELTHEGKVLEDLIDLFYVNETNEE